MGNSLKEGEGFNLGVILKMGVSLKEGKGFNLQMVNFQELQKWGLHNFEKEILKFRNDDVTRKFRNARRNRRIARIAKRAT